ncbi:MAG: efflux RND transporter periplasmic adaptor subunit [Anaerolineales bacterium]
MNLKQLLTSKKALLIGGGLLAMVILLAAVLPGKNAAANSAYQTEPARRGNLSAVVGATGTVRAEQSALLTWQTSGIVEKVNAALGDVVEKDEVLASLAQSSLPQNVILAEADLAAAQQALEDLLASDTARAQAAIALRKAQEAYDDAVEYRESLEGQIDIEYIVWVKGQPKVKTRRGYADETEKAKADEDAALKKGQLEDAQREYDRLKDGPNPQDVAAAKAKVAAAQAVLDQARIIAPFDGIITDASVLPGDQVSPGNMAFQVDDLSRLLIDLEVSEVDINSISVGQEVAVNFDAVQGKEYRGVVAEVAGAGTASAGSVNFKVTVELTDVDELVKPGMTAAVLIQVRNIEDALLVPNRAVRIVDNRRVVYVLEGDTLRPVEVRLGATSDTYSEVVGGDLQEGDLIVLNPPATLEMRPGGGNSPFRQ